MLFNSLEFLLFLPAVFVLYWFVFARNLKLQNLLILVASYVFYGWWDWRFLSLIVFSSLLDFLIGKKLDILAENNSRKILLGLSLTANLGLLGVFKYFNFFQQEFIELFQQLGIHLNPWSIRIILPVGISFYTFQTLSYTIDVYRRKLEPTGNLIDFMAFVSFFPQLVAGPIERASNLLPQFQKPRVFESDKARDGMRQMLWGLFKKVVIADNCAAFVQQVFENPSSYSPITLVLGAVLFAFQIYCDFSGYSDIAIGAARLFGFNLMRNFAYPYFSRDIAEFWRRWHISLSTWFRDYVYIPIGGSRVSLPLQIRNVFVIFIVSGFWHGANWTFMVWGAIHAILFIPLLLIGSNRKNLEVVASSGFFPTPRELVGMLVTFATVCLAWIFFRAESVGDAWNYLVSIFILSQDSITMWPVNWLGLLILALVAVEWISRNREHGLSISGLPRPVRWGSYYLIITLIWLFQPDTQTDFIYFQF